MAKVLRNNESIAPYLSERLAYIRGLDPLGLQNNSEATFAMLLPGLNNVTRRLRYYSFYCWLLDQYSVHIASTNPKEQEAFIRKAELLLALVMVQSNNEYSDVPGSNFASNYLQEASEVIDLASGIYTSDHKTATTYWKYPTGAFGQYYVASLINIGIVSSRADEAKLYSRTNTLEDSIFVSGEQLANAFDENIDPSHKSIFLDAVLSSQVSKSDITLLFESFNMMEIPLNTEEHRLLLHLLLQSDRMPLDTEEVPFHRKDTFKALLDFIQQQPVEKPTLAFVQENYNRFITEDLPTNDTLFGWYYYQVNDWFQFANTALFNGLLQQLTSEHGLNYADLTTFCNVVSTKVLTELMDTYEIEEAVTLQEFISQMENYILNEVEFCNNILHYEGLDRIVYGFELLIALFINNQQNLEAIDTYGHQNGIKRDGEASSYYLKKFTHKLSLPFKDFIYEYLVQNIVLRHHFVAFRKMGGGSQSTQKFVLEEGHIRYLGNFEPSFTGPRLTTLYLFLKDLKLVDNNKITAKGIAVLNDEALWLK